VIFFQRHCILAKLSTTEGTKTLQNMSQGLKNSEEYELFPVWEVLDQKNSRRNSTSPFRIELVVREAMH